MYFVAIVTVGFSSSIGQILILRELLVLFYGNELSTGLVFASWLFWVAMGSGLAGIWAHRLRTRFSVVSLALLFLALLLPLTVFWIRAARIIWNVPLGEILSPERMLGISFSSTGLFCLISGFLFTLIWAVQVKSTDEDGRQPLSVYLGEALGASLGGLFFYFIFLPHVSVLASAFITSLILLIVSCAVLQPWKKFSGIRPTFALRLFVFALTAVSFVFLPQLDHLSRQWQWGSHLLTVRDTPYHNLALVKDKTQLSLFSNGLWLFSVPDPLSAEMAVHPALLQHPSPRTVLLISGGVAGLVGEILKHPHIERVDYVEPDPELILLAEQYLPKSITAPIHFQNVHLFHQDAASFIHQTDRTYDVVLINVGDPVNAEMNRFYTVEFYRRIQNLLNPGGIFCFAVSSSPNVIGSTEIQYLKSIYITLHTVFSRIVVFPGENARFFAANHQGSLLTDPDELINRLHARKLELQYVQDFYFFDVLNPLRLDYIHMLLREQDPSRSDSQIMINRDFAPTCYFYGLVRWGAQLSTGFDRVLMSLTKVKRSYFWAGLAVVVFVMMTLLGIGDSKPRGAVAVSVMLIGAVLIVEQITLLLGFQILAGFVYESLALIISSFMAGLALGAAIVTRLSGRCIRPATERMGFILTQTLLCLYLTAIIGFLFLFQQHLQGLEQGMILEALFSVLALVGGIWGGGHFSMAVKIVSGLEVSSAKAGGGLYALDLIGAAIGSSIASLFLLPVYGLITTLMAFGLLTLGSLITLVFSLRRSKGGRF